MTTLYYDRDADLALIRGKKVASSATDPRATPTPRTCATRA